ncbi:MAG: sulfatase [Planctomycetota bacterium]
MNIVLIVVDTLRWDYIGANGNSWIRTPNLDRLAETSWRFDRCFAASYPTIPHRTDLITGRTGAPFHTWQPLAFDLPTLPRTLAAGGFATQLLHDTPHLVNGGHNMDWPFHFWQFVRGAEVDRPWIRDRIEPPENWGEDPCLADFRPAPDAGDDAWYLPTYVWANTPRRKPEDWNCRRLFDAAADFLQDNAGRDPFFLWVDCFDPHEPWDAPAECMLRYDTTPGYDGRLDPRLLHYRNHPDLPEEARRRVVASYAAKVDFVDQCLGRVLEALETTGLAETTAVVLTADHGTNVGENAHFGKSLPVREYEAHVPLFVRLPGEAGGRCDALCQPQDICATVAALAGCEAPDGCVGQDLLPLAREGRPGRALALAGVAADKWKREGILFTAFDGEWCLEVAARPDASVLRRLCFGAAGGGTEPVPYPAQETGEADRRDRMHAAALDELERRGAPAVLMEWIRSGGAPEAFPADARLHEPWPIPSGYAAYFSRNYAREHPEIR